MAPDEGAIDPDAELDGLDELLATPVEPMADDTFAAPVLDRLPPSARRAGGAPPLPIDTSRLGQEPQAPTLAEERESATSPGPRSVRGPRPHPPPVNAPPPSAPLDLAARATMAPPPAPVDVAPSVPRPTPSQDRAVPSRPAHPRVRRWFGRERPGPSGHADPPEPASQEP